MASKIPDSDVTVDLRPPLRMTDLTTDLDISLWATLFSLDLGLIQVVLSSKEANLFPLNSTETVCLSVIFFSRMELIVVGFPLLLRVSLANSLWFRLTVDVFCYSKRAKYGSALLLDKCSASFTADSALPLDWLWYRDDWHGMTESPGPGEDSKLLARKLGTPITLYY